MKKTILALFLLVSTVHAKPINGLHDYGELLSDSKFSTHCEINDPGISGNRTVDVYANGQISCASFQDAFIKTYSQILKYLSQLNYDLKSPAMIKTLKIRVLNLSQMNDPNNFAETDAKCMYNSKCETGAYYGRSFFADSSSNINVYVVYPRTNVDWKFSFSSTLKHELMHVILYRHHWNYMLFGDAEHKLIDRYLEWSRNR